MESGITDAVVIKIGGGVLDELTEFWPLVRKIQHPVIIVHGGGAQSTALANRLGHKPRIVQGRRVTTDLDLAIAEWTMRGTVNVQLVSQACAQGLKPVGLSGVDGKLIQVRKRVPWTIEGEVVDFGWVGEITCVNARVLTVLLEAGFLPIVAPLGVDETGQRYNVNADTVAGAIAASVKAKALLFVTETGGLLQDANQPKSLMKTCNATDVERGLAEGWISGGMGVKLTVAQTALESGVSRVFVLGPQDILEKKRATRVVK